MGIFDKKPQNKKEYISADGLYADSFDSSKIPQIKVTQKNENDIRICSFNVRCTDVNGVPREERGDIVLKQIHEINPDIIGLQEALPEWMDILKSGLTEYECVGTGRFASSHAKKNEHNPVFFKKDKFTLLETKTIWISTTPDVESKYQDAGFPRICTYALLKSKTDGKTIVETNCHLDHRSVSAREFGAGLIVNYMKEMFSGENVVVTGDFNSPKEEEAYKIMAKAYNDAADCSDSMVYPTYNDGEPVNGKIETIDFVFCSKNINIKSFRVVTTGIDGRLSSDHFPIYSDMEI